MMVVSFYSLDTVSNTRWMGWDGMGWDRTGPQVGIKPGTARTTSQCLTH